VPLLTLDEEKELAKKILNGDEEQKSVSPKQIFALLSASQSGMSAEECSFLT
jgi:hypothetical protein